MNNDSVALATQKIKEALTPFFRGPVMKNKLDDAVNSAVTAISSLLSLEPPRHHKLGASVMTEAAAANNGVKPRSV